ncbi:quinone oxidoreductase family protein [Acetobacter indonesiensis]
MAIEERPKLLPRPGYTLIKMHAATVNQLSGQIRRGFFDKAKTPLVLSNDGAGTVEDSDLFESGTRVAFYGGGQLGITEDGLQQEYVSVKNSQVFELPDTISLDEGAALPINYVTAYQALTRVGRIEPGQTVLISGAAGAVGHALIQLSRVLGAKPVAVVSSPLKAEAVRKSGAAAVVDLSTEILSDVLSSLTTGQGADLAFGPAGGTLLRELIKSVRERGQLCRSSFLAALNPAWIWLKSSFMKNAFCGYDAWLETDEAVSYAFSAIRIFIEKGAVRPIIDITWKLEEYEEAYRRLASRQAMGTILIKA